MVFTGDGSNHRRLVVFVLLSKRRVIVLLEEQALFWGRGIQGALYSSVLTGVLYHPLFHNLNKQCPLSLDSVWFSNAH